MVVATRPLSRRGRLRADRGGLRAAQAGRRAGGGGARGRSWCTRTCPGNVGAHLVQEVPSAAGRGAAEAIEAAPHTLAFRLDIERSASMPLEGRGVYARWDGTDLRVYSSTQTSTSVRMAIAAALGLPLPHVEVIAPDVGGGFGVKIVHPWPEEILVPWAAMLLGREVKWTEDRREHFISSAHERGQVQHVRVGLRRRRAGARAGRDDPARPRRLHAVRDHRADHHLDPAARSLPDRGVPGGVQRRLHQHRAGHARTGARDGRRACSAWSGPWTRSRGTWARTAPQVREVNFIQPDEFPYDQGMIFQDGRPLIYDSGDYPRDAAHGEGAHRLGRLPSPRRGRGIGIGCYVEGTGVGPYEGGHVQITSDGRVHVSTGLTSQGQGHETVFAQIAADRARRADRAGLGRHRRHPPVRLRGRAPSPPARP